MKNQQRDALRVHHMIEASELIAEFIADKSFDDLLSNRLLSSAIERQLEIIGEAANHVSPETQAEWPDLNWRAMKGTRNFLAHEYFRANYEKIWDVAQDILPAELAVLRELLTELESQFGGPDDAL